MSGVKDVYILASKMMNQNKNLEIISNNVANVNTAGYKKVKMDFASMVAKQNGVEVATFAQSAPLRVDFSAGSLSRTSNPLDIAISGEGMFAVSVNGETQYTRNGHFLMDREGNVINEQGNALLDRDFGPINIPIGTKQININTDGSISTEAGLLAEVGVFNIESSNSVENLGQGRYRIQGRGDLVEFPKVFQGMIEDANVQAVEETVKLTEIMRSYQESAQLVGRIEETAGRAIRDLSRMPN